MTEAAPLQALIGQSRPFLDALAHASAVAAIDRPVLICGERGSGKELLAERMHYLSPRWRGPFVKLNCAALSEDLLESELFGHEAGAFTGATKRRLGRFDRAAGGSLFLDEIASASPRIPEKLLRVAEYGEYERVGGEKTLKTDARVIAAANVDLRAMAASGAFRADLLDRLAFDVVLAPPLRERREDIPLLASHFASALAAEMDAPFDGFAPEALSALLAHDWPGNVRELKNAAERAFYRARAAGLDGPVATVPIDPFPAAASPVAATQKGTRIPADLRAEMDAIEKRFAEAALAAAHGSQKEAAASLGLTYDQMRGLVRKHRLAGK